MAKTPETRKPRIASPEAKFRLIEAVIHLLETTPFPEITARRIAAEVEMDPNVIFRNFGNTEGLFIAVLRELEEQIIANISPQSTSSNEVLRPVDFVALFLTFYTSLLLSGIPPERLAAPVELAEEFRTRTFERLGIDPGLSDRTKQAVFTLAISLVLAQTMLLPNQPNVFTPESTVDAITLMMALVERLPAIAQDLSWEE